MDSKGTMGNNSNHKKSLTPVIEIREMEIDDLAEVFHLGEKLFTSRRFPNLYRVWDEYEVTGLFQEEPELCFVADVDKKTIGFAMGTTISKARSPWKYGHLIWLGVDPAYHRSRVGTRLYNHFRDRVRGMGVRMLLIETDAENESAIRFFSKIGFAHPREHLYMTLNLENQ